MTIYHHKVEIKLACGCHYTEFFQLEDGEEPSSETASFSLYECLHEPTIMSLLMTDSHMERGGEKIDITVRTKVGPIPEDADDED